MGFQVLGMKQYSKFLATLLAVIFAASAVITPVQAGNGRPPLHANASAAAYSGTGAPKHLRQAFIERHLPERKEKLRKAIVAQERHQRSLMDFPGIVGTGISWDENDEAVVKIFIDNYASAASIPERIDDTKVVVEYTGKIYAQNVPCDLREGCVETAAGNFYSPNAASEPLEDCEDPVATQRNCHPRPVPIGISTGHKDVSAGTLACRVSNGCHTYALSNAHVYANENAGLVGDNILQPGVTDGGIDPDHTIGTLYDSVPIVMSLSANNEVDAAIIQTNTDFIGTATRSNGYGEPIAVNMNTALDPSPGMLVQKYGRTTAQTYGYIDTINATLYIGYQEGNARFINQIIIKEDLSIPQTRGFSKYGDSGSLIVGHVPVGDEGTIDRIPVGLLFAAGEDQSGVAITIANPIKKVLAELDVAIDGE
jgi:hypothetical protein